MNRIGRACGLLAAFILASVFAPAARAVPGDFDVSFGAGGAATAYASTFGSELAAVAWQGNKLLVAGTSRRNDGHDQGPAEFRIVVRRYLSDGTLDTTFGTPGFGGEVVLGVLPKDVRAYEGNPRGPRHVHIAALPGGSFFPKIVVYADFEGEADALFYWGMDADGKAIDYQAFLPYNPPSPVTSLLYGHTIGAIAVTAAGDVIIAGTVRYEDAERIYVRKLIGGVPGYGGPQVLVTDFYSRSVTGIALYEGMTESENRYYLSATPHDPTAGSDQGSVVVAVQPGLNPADPLDPLILATEFNGNGFKSFGGNESAGVVVVPGTPQKVRVATVDSSDYRLTQANHDGTTDTAYGTAGTVQHAIGVGHSRAFGLVRPAAGGAVLAVMDADQFGYWRTSEAGVDLGLTIPGFIDAATGAASAIAVADNKVAVGGIVASGSNVRSNAITVFDDQGVLDTVFGGGLVQVAGSTKAPLSAQAMVRQSTGRIVTGALSCSSLSTSPPLCKIVLQGYTDAGAVDLGFGASEGRVEFPIAGDANVWRLLLALGPLDQIVAAYQGDNNSMSVVRFAADGGGSPLVDRFDSPLGTAWIALEGLAVDTNGRALVLFNRWAGPPWSSNLAVAARKLLGGPDLSFGFANGLFLSTGPGSDEGFGIATDVANRVVVAGWRRDTRDALLVRLTATGDLDPSFNFAGVPGHPTGILHALAVSNGGTIYATGLALTPNFVNFVAAYQDNGQPDGGFAGCGVADLSLFSFRRASKVTLDEPDYLVISGFEAATRVGLAGALDQQFSWPWGGPWSPVWEAQYPTVGGTATAYRALRTTLGAAVVPGGYAIAHPYFRQDTYEGMSVAKYVRGGGARATVNLTGPTNVSVGVPVSYSAATATDSSGRIRFRFGCPSPGETVDLVSNSATLSHTFTAPGTYIVSAVHEGDPARAPAIAAPLVVTVTAGSTPTTTVLESAPKPSVFGQSVRLTATVSGGTPTGTVTFNDGATVIGTGSIAAGEATLDIATLSVGPHGLTATYGGDGSNASSTSTPPLVHTVNKASTSTALGASPATSRFGEEVTLTATVTVTAPGAGPLTGSVSFLDGTTLLGGAVLDASGKATFKTSSLSVGDYMIKADYPETATHFGSFAPPSGVSVLRADASATLVAPPSPVYGQQATLSSTVSAVAPGSGVPQGKVQFGDGSAIGSDVQLDAAGSASVAWTPLTPGPVTLSAAYSGNASFNPTTPTRNVTVAKGAVTGTASTLPATVVINSPAKLLVQIGKVGNGALPGGTVTFKVDNVFIGNATLSSNPASVDYTATIAGDKTLEWSYGGDVNYAPSIGTSTFTVLGPSELVFSIVDGNNQGAKPDSQFALPLRVKIATATGVPVQGYTVNFTAATHPVSGATAELSPQTAQTDSDGIAATMATARVGGGAYNVTAESNVGTQQFSLLNLVDSATTGGGTVVSLPGPVSRVTLVEVKDVSPPSPLPANVTSFPYGLVGFTLEGLAPGAAVQVTLTFPSDVTGTTYYKYRNGGYFPFPGAVISDNTVTLTLVDGGVGDADGVADGRIVDPGGPAIVTAVGAPVTPVPTLSAGALVLLAAMLGLCALAARRRATPPSRKGPH